MARTEKGAAKVVFLAATKGEDNPIRAMIAAGWPLRKVFKTFSRELAGCSYTRFRVYAQMHLGVSKGAARTTKPATPLPEARRTPADQSTIEDEANAERHAEPRAGRRGNERGESLHPRQTYFRPVPSSEWRRAVLHPHPLDHGYWHAGCKGPA